jgi:uncharacterized protein
MTSAQRTLIWRGLSDPSMEFCTLKQTAAGWQLAGTVVAVQAGQPLRASYAIGCSADWRTERVELTVTDAEAERSLSLRPTDDGGWLVDDQPLDAVAGCIDIDLGITPATNTLPIRRLNLAVGESADVEATWVRFPSLTIQPLSQRYTRVSEHCYRYESDSGFSCVLDVDDDGLVTSYPDGWERAD